MSTSDGFVWFFRDNFFSDINFFLKFYSDKGRTKGLKLCENDARNYAQYMMRNAILRNHLKQYTTHLWFLWFLWFIGATYHWDIGITFEKLVNHWPPSHDLQYLLVFFQHLGLFIELIYYRNVWSSYCLNVRTLYDQHHTLKMIISNTLLNF